MGINIKNLISRTKKNSWQTGRNHDGFTLIEVLVSMVILSIGIFGTIKTADMVIFHQKNSWSITRATLLTTNKIEKIKHIDFDELTTISDVPDTDDWTTKTNTNLIEIETIGTTDRFIVTTNLQVYPSDSVGGFIDDPSSIRMLELVVKTGWTNHRGNSREVEIATILSRGRPVIE